MLRISVLVCLVMVLVSACGNHKGSSNDELKDIGSATQIDKFILSRVPDSLLGVGCAYAETKADYDKTNLIALIDVSPKHEKLVLLINKKFEVFNTVAFDTNIAMKESEILIKFSNEYFNAFADLVDSGKANTETNTSQGKLTLICPDGSRITKQLVGVCGNY